jgi:hypothetical protein
MKEPELTPEQEIEVVEPVKPTPDQLIKQILETELGFLLTKAQSNTLSLDDAKKLETLIKVIDHIQVKPLSNDAGEISNDDILKLLANK